jgi:hypothetical protein
MINFKIFINKKGLTLIEVMIALVIFIFPIFATLSTVTFLYKQTTSRHFELLAENLNNYILEDLRGRKFFINNNLNSKLSLNGAYENLPNTKYVPNPFFSGADLKMKYQENMIVDENNPYFDFDFLRPDGTLINLKNFYKAFTFDLYITRYPVDITNPDSIYEIIYKIDLVVKWNEGIRDRLIKSSTEVAYHEP